MEVTGAEDRATVGTNLSAVSGAKTEWGRHDALCAIRDWHSSAKSIRTQLRLSLVLTRGSNRSDLCFLVATGIDKLPRHHTTPFTDAPLRLIRLMRALFREVPEFSV
jgi:hypothetical protein